MPSAPKIINPEHLPPITMTLDILICSIDKGIVRIVDVLLPPQPQIRYLISYQYTDERYLELIPEQLVNRSDVLLYKYKGQGLAANRNLALERATSEYVMFADDDTRISPDITSIIFSFSFYFFWKSATAQEQSYN